MNKNTKPWKTLSKKIVHENKYFNISHEKYSLPKNKSANYYIYNSNNGSNKSVLIVPIINDEIIVIKQYRYLTKNWTIEIPGGGLKKNYTFLKTAKEELIEETGYKARKMKHICNFDPFTGISREICAVYLAYDLKYIGQNLDKEEFGMKIKKMKIKKLYNLVDNKGIISGPILAALTLVRKELTEFIKNNKNK